MQRRTKEEADDDGPGHDLAKPVNELANMEDAREVQGGSSDERGIPACEGVAIVH